MLRVEEEKESKHTEDELENLWNSICDGNESNETIPHAFGFLKPHI